TVTLQPLPPGPTPRGPDRLVSPLAVNVGTSQFAILPQGTVTSMTPVSGAISFVGAPSLDGTLAGASYDLTGAAVTGANGAQPPSVVTRVETTSANAPVAIGGFLPIPSLLQPSTSNWSGTHVALQ